MIINELMKYFEEKYPSILASDFDKDVIGLQFGNINAKVEKVLACLDVTSDVIDEAIKIGCDTIISHHPFMFHPIVKVDYESSIGKKIHRVISNRINIISLHTNFDCALTGMNYLLAQNLGISPIEYEGELSNKSIIRYGTIAETTLLELTDHVKRTLNIHHLKIVGSLEKKITKIGIVGGSGQSELHVAKRNCLDCLITGEVKHHVALEAIELDIAIIEVNHAVEAIFIEKITSDLSCFSDIKVFKASANPDPFFSI